METDMTRQPVVLDIDDSVGPLADELRLSLQTWQEQVRFGCGLARFARFRAMLDTARCSWAAVTSTISPGR